MLFPTHHGGSCKHPHFNNCPKEERLDISYMNTSVRRGGSCKRLGLLPDIGDSVSNRDIRLMGGMSSSSWKACKLGLLKGWRVM